MLSRGEVPSAAALERAMLLAKLTGHLRYFHEFHSNKWFADCVTTFISPVPNIWITGLWEYRVRAYGWYVDDAAQRTYSFPLDLDSTLDTD